MTLAILVDTYGYNSFGEVTSYGVQLSGSPIITFGYTRDDAGRIATKTETANGQTTTTSYAYDPAGRLTDVTTGSATTHYVYDDNGNRTSVTTPSGTIAATYDAQDRMTTYNGASYFYSDNGELQKKIDAQGTTLYNYDVLGNLRSVTLPDGRLIEYVIDASNRRVGKKVNGTLVAGWIYADQLRIIAETDGSGAVTKRFVYGSSAIILDYMTWQGSTYRIIADHLGSPRHVVEASAGTLAESSAYDEFGNVLSDTNPGFIPFGFAGGLYDRDTHLTHFGARDYDASIGRWTAKDALLFGSGDLSVYTYSGNDPVNWLDPTGLREGSAANLAKRRAIDQIARKYRGSKAWAKNATKGPFGAGTWKCNEFVYDVTHEAGAEARYAGRPPRAGDWADPNTRINNWRVLRDDENPMPGDVAAYQLSGGGADFSGHSGVMITGPDGSTMNIRRADHEPGS